MKPMERILFRCFMFAFIGLGVAVAITTIGVLVKFTIYVQYVCMYFTTFLTISSIKYHLLVVLTTYDGSSGHLYSGIEWAQIFGTTQKLSLYIN